MSLKGVIFHVYIHFSYPANVTKLQVLKIWLLKKIVSLDIEIVEQWELLILYTGSLLLYNIG